MERCVCAKQYNHYRNKQRAEKIVVGRLLKYVKENNLIVINNWEEADINIEKKRGKDVKIVNKGGISIRLWSDCFPFAILPEKPFVTRGDINHGKA